jgi:hypothetical protein
MRNYKMKAICSSETSVCFQRTTRRYNPEDSTVPNHRSENVKSCIRQLCSHTLTCQETIGVWEASLCGSRWNVLKRYCYCYKYYVSGHYPSSCFHLKTSSCLFLKTQRFGDWIVSVSGDRD